MEKWGKEAQKGAANLGRPLKRANLQASEREKKADLIEWAPERLLFGATSGRRLEHANEAEFGRADGQWAPVVRLALSGDLRESQGFYTAGPLVAGDESAR